MMFVYETERPDRITFPAIPKGGLEARERCVEHLRKVSKFVGPFKWQDQETMDKFDKWFKSLVTPEDEILEGFYEAKDVLVLKIAICLAMAQAEPKLVLTWPLIELAIAFLFTVEENLPKLTIAAGRNELAIPTQALLDLLEARGKGLMPEKAWHREALKNMNDSEYQSVRRSLQDTDQIFIVNIPGKLNGTTTNTRSIVTARRYAEMIKSGEIKVNSQPVTPT
jgi:hypothetical protein